MKKIFQYIPFRDVEYVSDIRSALLVQSPRGCRLILWTIVLLFFSGIYWAAISEIDEVTRGGGKVIPSQQIQVVQNLEGGILAEILVREGDIVNKGQLLLKIDDRRYAGPVQENRVRHQALQAKIARLKAEAENTPFLLAEGTDAELREAGEREKALFQSRKDELEAKIAILQEQASQKKHEMNELNAKKKQLSHTAGLIQQELELTRPLVKAGAASEIEVLRLERQAAQIEEQIIAVQFTLPQVRSKYDEALKSIEKEKRIFTNRAKEELTDVYAEMEGLSASAVTLEDRLQRTLVHSPVYGTVKQIMVNTIGGVIQPGMDLIEIVPLEDTLLVEAMIKPSDIAFLRPKQKAMVKFSAYDFTIYGGLHAELEHISADSITDEKGNSYYLVRVRTDKNYLGEEANPLPIIPGMVATVDILTGKKTILSYLLQPVIRTQKMALRER
ncbi:MAG: HlyD family type I secretion periplasmic adaptor subunit [Thermodesulfobacteriota bacterium]